MIDLEQRLKAYYEAHYYDYHPEECEGYDEYLQKLKALEASPEAAKRPPRRRRYVLPIAAAIALAVALGGWYAWQHAVTPEPAQTPVAIQSGPANAFAESQIEPSKPAAKPYAETKEPKPEVEQIPEETVTLTNPPASPMSGGNTPSGSNGGAASTSNYRPHVLPDGSVTAKPGDTLPVLPTDEMPGNPNDETAVNPDEEASAGPSGETQVKPNDETTTEPAVEPSTEPDDEKPDDPKPAESDYSLPAGPVDPNPQTPEDPDPPEITPPPDDPPYVTMEKNGINASYWTGDDGESMTFTLMSTGESIVVDVTGWMDELPDDPQPGGAQAVSVSTYTGFCTAFDRIIVYYLIRNEDETVRIELDVIELKKETEQRKEGDYET